MLSELIEAVRSACEPCRLLDRAIWQTIDPVAAYQKADAPFFTDDPHSAKLILAHLPALLVSSGNRINGFEALVIFNTEQTTIRGTHPTNRFLAMCLAALRARADYPPDVRSH